MLNVYLLTHLLIFSLKYLLRKLFLIRLSYRCEALCGQLDIFILSHGKWKGYIGFVQYPSGCTSKPRNLHILHKHTLMYIKCQDFPEPFGVRNHKFSIWKTLSVNIWALNEYYAVGNALLKRLTCLIFMYYF